MEYASPAKLDLGQLLAATMQLLARSPLVTLLVVGIGAGLDTWLWSADVGFGYLVAASMALYFVAGFVLLCSILRRSGLGSDAIIYDFAGCLTLYVVTTLAIGLGLVLLIVPGIILAVRWMPAFALRMAEPIGLRESLRCSWAMTAGSEWPIFTAMLVTMGAPVLLTIVLLSAGVNTDPSLGGTYSIGWSAVESLAHCCSSAFLWAMSASTYLLRRNDTAGLAQTFA